MNNMIFPFWMILMETIFFTAFQVPVKEKLQIAAQMEYSIQKELLNSWYPRSVDNKFGGFFSTYTYDFKLEGAQDKMIVTQARHVWSNAKASELYPGNLYFKTS